MGNNQSVTSSVQNISNQLYINRSTVNQLTQQLNSVIANTVVKNAVSSGGDIINSQSIIFKNISTSGSFTIDDASQKQSAAITFDALNKTEARNESASQFMQQALTDIKSIVSTDILSKMESNAETTSKTGFGSGGIFEKDKTHSEAINTANVSAITENVQNISNILKNRIENNFTTDVLTSCLTNINNSQIFAVENVTVGGDFLVHNMTQDQAATAVSQCKSITNSTNNIITDTLNACDVKVDESNSLKSETSETGESKTASEKSGFFEGLSKIFSLDSLLSVLLLSIIGIIVFIVVVIIIIKLI